MHLVERGKRVGMAEKEKGEERERREEKGKGGMEGRVYCLSEFKYWLRHCTVTTNGECHVIHATVLNFTIK